MKTIAIIFGTRPEAIKLCPLATALSGHGRLRAKVCVTAQHRSMLDQVLAVFGVVPETDLDLMRPGQGLAAYAARALEALDGYFARERPDLAVVQGDTTTALVAALAAYYRRVPVAHVEAGLRTGDKYAPFPEEINRTLVSRIADLHFAPTARSRGALLAEGTPADRIFVTGNTVIDALLMTVAKARSAPPAVAGVSPEVMAGVDGRRLVLITGHRRENFGPGLLSICRAIGRLADRFGDVLFVYPVHLNPEARGPVFELLSGRPNLCLIEPLPYLPFVALMDRSTLIITDSGGVQEEAPSLGKPTLVTRAVTERPEAVEAGAVKLVGADEDRLFGEAARLLDDPAAHAAMARVQNPYGDGRATERIVEILERWLCR